MATNTDALKTVLQSPAMKQVVADYVVKKAEAQVLREEVDKVYASILDEVPAYATLCGEDGHRITDHKHIYLCEDESTCSLIYAMADSRLKNAGIKPLDMEMDYCPALVAESELTDIEHEIVDLTGPAMGIDLNQLLCNGLETYHKWIDLVIGGAFALEREA